MKIKNIGCLVALGISFAGCGTLSPTNDRELQQAITERLGQDDLVRRQMLSVSVQAGVPILRGVVHDEAVRARALSIAQGTPGVEKKVQDQTVRP